MVSVSTLVRRMFLPLAAVGAITALAAVPVQAAPAATSAVVGGNYQIRSQGVLFTAMQAAKDVGGDLVTPVFNGSFTPGVAAPASQRWTVLAIDSTTFWIVSTGVSQGWNLACLGVSGGSVQPNAHIYTLPCDTTNLSQRWTFESTLPFPAYSQIRNVKSHLVIDGKVQSGGTALTQQPKATDTNALLGQSWALQPV